MSNVDERFLLLLYDMPTEIKRKFPKADVRVKNNKKIKFGDFDDWGSGVAGTYESYVVDKNSEKQIAVITTVITLKDRWQEDEEGNEEQPYDGFEDAADINITDIKYLEEVNKK